ncbi:MAG: hypothetical protein HY674_14940 [Chloroflexi bacterium]|nr:hypothetical protein [Chloroflexota bacterium]
MKTNLTRSSTFSVRCSMFDVLVPLLLLLDPPLGVRAQSNYAEEYTFTTLVGAAPGAIDGPGSAARFHLPIRRIWWSECFWSHMAVDGSGNVYVADSGNHTIRKITAAGEVSTLAGKAGESGTTDGTGSAARFNTPSGVAVDAVGNVYVADMGNNTIRKVTPNGEATTLAGLAGESGSADGAGSAARFDQPTGLAIDSAGNV